MSSVILRVTGTLTLVNKRNTVNHGYWLIVHIIPRPVWRTYFSSGERSGVDFFSKLTSIATGYHRRVAAYENLALASFASFATSGVCVPGNPFFIRGREINVPVTRRHRYCAHLFWIFVTDAPKRIAQNNHGCPADSFADHVTVVNRLADTTAVYATAL